MTRNPILNAFTAIAYISLLVSIIYFGPKPEHELSAALMPLMPIAMLSLLVLSVSVMGYLFFFEPFKLYFDGKREEALNFFLKTVGVFAVITAFILALLFALSVKLV